MTDNLCRAGERFVDTSSKLCRGGTRVDRLCRGGEVVYEVNHITLGAFTHTSICAVTFGNSTAQFLMRLLPSGNIQVGTHATPLAVVGTWQDGTVAAANYEVRMTFLGGAILPTTPADGVWTPLATQVDILIEATGSVLVPVETFTVLQLDIRRIGGTELLGSTAFCQHVGSNTPCQSC